MRLTSDAIFIITLISRAMNGEFVIAAIVRFRARKLGFVMAPAECSRQNIGLMELWISRGP